MKFFSEMSAIFAMFPMVTGMKRPTGAAGPGAGVDNWILEESTDAWQLEEDTSVWLLE